MPLIKKFSLKQLLLYILILFPLILLLVIPCLRANDARRFDRLSRELFCSELSGNTLSLHYTLAYPKTYGLDGDACLSSYTPGTEGDCSGLISLLEQLSSISPEHLDAQDAYAHKLLTRYLSLQLEGASYPYYSEPLTPSSGMQSGLPILLADYTFRSSDDVEDYLELLDQTDTYFEGLIEYEKEKAENGLFMSDSSAARVIEQCFAIMDSQSLENGTHFLHTTFEERIAALAEQTPVSKEQQLLWISENDRLLTTVMAPAYERVADAFTILQGSGSNSMGLAHFPDGKAYYEYLLAYSTGSSRSIPEIKQLLYEDYQQNFSSLIALLHQYPNLAVMTEADDDFPFESPGDMLAHLETSMAPDFPVFPNTGEAFVPVCIVKSVSPSMEKYCSPAYYLTPPIDDMSANIIYINRGTSPGALTLYTTLAHEGYPGHLYQTVYSQLYMNQTDASPIRQLLHFGGYVEGWALYVENMSYTYAQSLVAGDDPQKAAWYEACRLNRSLQLCLYSLLDIAIHYEGASPLDTGRILSHLGITNPEAAAAIYQYIAEEPANYLKYYLGFLEILDLKEKAQATWGDTFTVRRFHQFVLETGPSDFESLKEALEADTHLQKN